MCSYKIPRKQIFLSGVVKEGGFLLPKYTLPCLDYLTCPIFKNLVNLSDNDIRHAVKNSCAHCTDSIVVACSNIEKIDTHILKLVNDTLENIGGNSNG